MRQLFGGAIVCDFPATYEDVSYLRETSDNEEVFQEQQTDTSFIVELLEYQNDVADVNIGKFHFDNIAEENEVKTFNIESSFVTKANPASGALQFFCCAGPQTGIAKFRENDPLGNDIYVWVAVARFKQLNLEIVISLSAPISISSASSSHALGSIPDVQRGKQVFERVVTTFRVLDFGLFG